MAAQVALKFKSNRGMAFLVLRDPSHCVDLCLKDLAKTDVVSRVVSNYKIVINFTKTDRIQCMKKEMLCDGNLEEDGKNTDMVHTIM